VKRLQTLVLALLATLGLVLSACGAQNTTPANNNAAAPGGGGTKTAIIGYTASLTGKLNVESTRQSNGLKLWMDQVNEKGGVKLADGTTVTFEAKFYDDESNKDRVQELYTRLATDDKADFLISPYSSGLSDAAAVIAEQYGRIMITTGAAADDTYKKGYTLVYQAYTPASRYLTGSIDMLAQLDPAAKKVAIVNENEKFSKGVADAVKAYAESKGLQVVLFEGYDAGTTDFAPIINKIQQAAPDVILGGGHFQDGSTLAKQIREKNLNVKMVGLLVAPPEPKFAELGDAALGVIGPSQWEPQVNFTAEAAQQKGMEWFGPTGSEFVSAYQAKFNEEPSYHAAGGYVAGLLLQKAIEKAGSLETTAVKSALDYTNMLTFFGALKFEVDPQAHGLQVGHDMVFVQWQQGSDGKLVKQVVWPTEGATAKALYPVR
jgi:branched-chain amino acid transport system substrate-binding protein